MSSVYKKSATKDSGFTLIELVIVLALIGISSVISLRFISDMARSQAAAAERSQALAGARFAMERLRRELSQAYSPSVQVGKNNKHEDNRCIHFVPVIAAGAYTGLVTQDAAEFILPQKVIENFDLINNSLMAITASNLSHWLSYPSELPDNVMAISEPVIENTVTSVKFNELFSANSEFSSDNARGRYTLLKPEQVSFCLQGEQLFRQVKRLASVSEPALMLAGIQASSTFTDYNDALQLLTLELVMKTRDGDLVLATQLQVNYEP